MAFLRKLMQCACVACALSLQSTNVGAEPENGWWWNPSESGRGFFIESTSGVIYLAGYFYESDGRATWLSSGGPNPDPYLYQGTLQQYRNGQTLFGAYRPPDPSVDVGPIEVKFTDDRHGTITWPGGTIPIERDIFGAEDEIPFELWVSDLFEPPFKPETGWWWNDAESGRGFSIEVQGPNLFIVSFMYDDIGNPIWYFSAGPMTTPTHYEGDVVLFAGGQTLTGPYHPPTTPQTIGHMTIDFTATDDATITITDDASSKAFVSSAISKRTTGGIRSRLQIPRRIFGRDDQWPQWIGSVSQSFVVTGESAPNGTFTTNEKYTYALEWIRIPDAQVATRALAVYTLASTSQVGYEYSTEDTSNGCKQSASEESGGLEGTLTIRYDMSYAARVTLPGGLIALVDEVCPDQPTTERERTAVVYVTFGGPQEHVRGMSPSWAATSSTFSPLMYGFQFDRVDNGNKAYLHWDLKAK